MVGGVDAQASDPLARLRGVGAARAARRPAIIYS